MCFALGVSLSLSHSGSIQLAEAKDTHCGLHALCAHSLWLCPTLSLCLAPRVMTAALQSLFIAEYITVQLTANVSPAGESSGSNSQVPDVKRFSAAEIERCTAHAYSTYLGTCIQHMCRISVDAHASRHSHRSHQSSLTTHTAHNYAYLSLASICMHVHISHRHRRTCKNTARTLSRERHAHSSAHERCASRLVRVTQRGVHDKNDWVGRLNEIYR